MQKKCQVQHSLSGIYGYILQSLLSAKKDQIKADQIRTHTVQDGPKK